MRQKKGTTSPSGSRQPTAIDLQIGTLIRARRLALELRQEDLARSLGITQHQLQKYEVGENRIAASRLIECAQILGVPVVSFYQTPDTAPKRIPPVGLPVTSGETEILQAYRNLSVAGRAQLVAIANVMQSGAPRAMGKTHGA